MSLDTPHGLMAHLVTYITDDLAIIAHLRREFNANYTIKDVQLCRRENRPVRTRAPEPIGTSDLTDWKRQARLSDARMVDKLRRHHGAGA
jgi:hypothetical protein